MYQALANLMSEHGENAADLSKATGISEALISTWKRRDNGMSLENAMKISTHYKIPLEELARRMKEDE